MEQVTISKNEYERLKMQSKMANIDTGLLVQLIRSIKDIQAGRARRVR